MKLKQSLASVKLIPSSGGRFEVTLGNELIYSKLKTGKFPDHDAIVRAIQTKVEGV